MVRTIRSHPQNCLSQPNCGHQKPFAIIVNTAALYRAPLHAYFRSNSTHHSSRSIHTSSAFLWCISRYSRFLFLFFLFLFPSRLLHAIYTLALVSLILCRAHLDCSSRSFFFNYFSLHVRSFSIPTDSEFGASALTRAPLAHCLRNSFPLAPRPVRMASASYDRESKEEIRAATQSSSRYSSDSRENNKQKEIGKQREREKIKEVRDIFPAQTKATVPSETDRNGEGGQFLRGTRKRRVLPRSLPESARGCPEVESSTGPAVLSLRRHWRPSAHVGVTTARR